MEIARIPSDPGDEIDGLIAKSRSRMAFAVASGSPREGCEHLGRRVSPDAGPVWKGRTNGSYADIPEVINSEQQKKRRDS